MTSRSSRSRSAPSSAQNHSGNSHARHHKSALQRKRIEEGKRAAIHEVGDARRAQVYRTDVEFAPSDAPTPLPARGSDERKKLVAEVVRLRQTGLSHMKITHALYPTWPFWSPSTIANLLKEGEEK